MDANLSMEQIRMDVKNVTALNQEGYDMNGCCCSRRSKFIIPILTKNVTGMSGNIFSAFLKCKYCIILQYHITRNSHSVLL